MNARLQSSTLSQLETNVPAASALVQRKCDCGSAAGLTGKCQDCNKDDFVGVDSPPVQAKLRIGEPDDKYEQEADRVADEVMSMPEPGAQASVTNKTGEEPIQAKPLTTSITPLVQRQSPEEAQPKTNEESAKEALKKTGEAFLETETGKKIKDQATDLVFTLPGIIITGSAAIGAVSYLAAKNKELPFQAPAIPLDKLHPGLSMNIVVEGPLQSPTKATIGFSGQFGIPKKGREKPKQSRAEKQRAENARKQKELFEFRESLKTPEQKAQDQAMLNAWILRGMNDPANPLFIPGAKPKEKAVAPETKKKEEGTIQRKKLSQQSVSSSTNHEMVGRALRSGGRSMDSETRGFMEKRFGRSFETVRIHNDSSAANSASALDAKAYTVGSNIVFNTGQYDPKSSTGKRLLAHELAHVVQQKGTALTAPEPNTMVSRKEQKDNDLKISDNAPDDLIQRKIVTDPAGGCGLCHGPQRSGGIAHQMIQQELALVNPLALSELPIPSSPGDTTPPQQRPRLDLAIATPVGLMIGEIKPANASGLTEGAKDLAFYHSTLKAGFPHSKITPLSIPIPAPVVPFPNPQVKNPACPPQFLFINPPVNGLYTYFCEPTFSLLKRNPACACRPRGRDPRVPVPVPVPKPVSLLDKIKESLRNAWDSLGDFGKAVVITIAVAVAAFVVAKLVIAAVAALAAAAAKLAVVLGLTALAALLLLLVLPAGEAQAKSATGKPGDKGSPSPDGAPSQQPSDTGKPKESELDGSVPKSPGQGSEKVDKNKAESGGLNKGPQSQNPEAQGQTEAGKGQQPQSEGEGSVGDSIIGTIKEFIDRLLGKKPAPKIEINQEALESLIVIVEDAEKSIQLLPGGKLLAIILGKIGDFLKGLRKKRKRGKAGKRPKTGGSKSGSNSKEKSDKSAGEGERPPSGKSSGQKSEDDRDEAEGDRDEAEGDRDEAEGDPAQGEVEEPESADGSGSKEKDSEGSSAEGAGTQDKGSSSDKGGGSSAVGLAGDWPVIFEELKGVGFSVHADISVDNGTGAIMLPDNPKAVLRFKSPSSMVIVNVTNGLEVGVAKKSSISSDHFELVSGPLFDRLKADLIPWIRKNRSAEMAREIINNPKKYPRRLHFKVTFMPPL